MNTLSLNISYDIAALALLLAVLSVHMTAYRYASPGSRAFARFLYASLGNCAVDLAAALAVNHSAAVPDVLNLPCTPPAS